MNTNNRVWSIIGLTVITCLIIYYLYDFISRGGFSNVNGFHTSAFTNGLYFGATGNIGVGTNNPGYKLEVIGDVNYTGSLYNNGVAFSGGSDLWSSSGSNIYYSSGNVGIGTDNPGGNKLKIYGSTAVSLELSSDLAHESNFNFTRANASPYWQLGQNAGSNDFRVYNGGGGAGEVFRIQSGTGNVSIKGTSSICPLHVTTTNTADWSITDGVRVGGHGASQGFLQMGCNPSTGRGWIHTFMNGAGGEGSGSYSKLCLQSAGGTVGIGTNNPVFPLHVTAANVSGDPVYQHGYLNNTGAGNGGNQGGNLFSVQAKFTGVVHADTYRAVSDERIKKDILEIDDGDALIKLRAIQPKKYKYIDTVSKGDGEVYGFIAQEVKQVFPEAVALDRDYIPDIYQLISPDMANHRISLSNSKSGNIKIIGMKGPKNITVTAISGSVVSFPPSAILPEDLNNGRVFIYGYEVDDFHCMKKDFLWAINFAASQELDRQVQELKSVIENVKVRLTSLEQK